MVRVPRHAEPRPLFSPPQPFLAPKWANTSPPYEAARTAPNPRQAVHDFLQSTYAAAANLSGWDRAALERR